MAAIPQDELPGPAAIAAIIAAVDLERTFGAYLVCTCLACIMFGLTTHQTYRYYRLYPTDLLSLKILVFIILMLDVLHTISGIHICYFYLVTNFFNPGRLADGVWSIRLIILETGLIILCSHCFYARRLFFLSNRNWIPVATIASLLLVEIGFCIAAAIESFVQVSFAKFIRYNYLLWTILVVAVAIDVLAAGTLTYYLRKSRTGFRKTDSMVDILMVYAINTGLSTSILSVAALICALVMPDNLVYSAILLICSKMYSNSLLAVLNSRRSLLDKGMEGFETGSFGLEAPEKPIQPSSPGLGVLAFRPILPALAKRSPATIDVTVTRETFVDISPQAAHAALRRSVGSGL
ncbi:uncharacterized protein TRAVEDRAFT_65520 [Trametes versicolor FP-101664 SS1]|uniref:uncharacterized protein n=1 Tax=Trametes versicolor (strain FP-101664) TaxID=717944 RepID=UPI00046216C0|nr:uncharacterized protein TRAVEDRAFT_65520 [Trametes versicolor FP-101664 SS1]EIW57917.1 hypothetical protein TRAVEDRAFT_65520 [Trametes versicolor FP-101664 SS1]